MSPALREQHPEVPWSGVVAMRNILVHRYFGVDTAIVWAAVENDLPALKHSIEGIARASGEAS